jgi:hypothetical protein
MNRFAVMLIAAICVSPSIAAAQVTQVTTPPPNLVISNYNSTAVGPFGGLEGTAYVARINDPSSSWFNPAGLAKLGSPEISGSAGVYQRTAVSPHAFPNQGGSIQQLPNFVGFTFVPRNRFTVGASLLSTNSWSQETDSELISPIAGGQQRFAYSADSGFEQRVAAIAVGYRGSDSWRVGGGFAFSLMDLRLVQSATERLADATGLRSILISARASGSALQLRGQGGAQYEKGQLSVGAAMRTPGVTLHRSGSTIFDGVLTNDPASIGASLFDADAHLEYRLPWEFQVGAAYSGARFQLELDVQSYTSIDAYSLLSSTQPVLVYEDPGGSAPPVVTSRPVAGLTSASKSVMNVALGGHFKPFEARDLRVHAGVSSNQSPVTGDDMVFTSVNLTTWSVGASGTLGKFKFAAGLNHQSGDADDVTLYNRLTGTPVTSPVDVRIAGFIYSIAYQF